MKIRRSPGGPTAVLSCIVLGRQFLLRRHEVILSAASVNGCGNYTLN
jgi:hypothetical protein